MHRGKIRSVQGKRAAWAGLFLGVLFGVSACVKPVIQPGTTGTPVPSPTGAVLPTPEQGTPTTEPVLTEAPGLTTGTPGVTSGITVGPTSVVTPGVGPDMTAGPEVTSTPVPTVTPDLFGTPTPEPTGLPEYDTLLQSGWQRTEDFYGSKEIFFSGKFDQTELIAVPGRYEYRYTASSDPEISFSVIGDEITPIQQFLDELVGKAIECYIERETETDYRYLYTDGEYTVEGRVYDCGTEGMTRCMRVEFRKAGMEENIAEGHEFYLKEKRNAE